MINENKGNMLGRHQRGLAIIVRKLQERPDEKAFFHGVTQASQTLPTLVVECHHANAFDAYHRIGLDPLVLFSYVFRDDVAIPSRRRGAAGRHSEIKKVMKQDDVFGAQEHATSIQESKLDVDGIVSLLVYGEDRFQYLAGRLARHAEEDRLLQASKENPEGIVGEAVGGKLHYQVVTCAQASCSTYTRLQ